MEIQPQIERLFMGRYVGVGVCDQMDMLALDQMGVLALN